MFKIDELLNNPHPQAFIDGVWVASRPIIGCLKSRIKDAWKVLIGKADAIEWFKQ